MKPSRMLVIEYFKHIDSISSKKSIYFDRMKRYRMLQSIVEMEEFADWLIEAGRMKISKNK